MSYSAWYWGNSFISCCTENTASKLRNSLAAMKYTTGGTQAHQFSTSQFLSFVTKMC